MLHTKSVYLSVSQCFTAPNTLENFATDFRYFFADYAVCIDKKTGKPYKAADAGLVHSHSSYTILYCGINASYVN